MIVVEPQAIRTERLELLPLQVDHAEEMAEVLADPALHTFIGGSPLDPAGLRARYARLVAGSPEPATSWCNWVIRLSEAGRLTGTVQATVTTADDRATAEIAWVVGASWQRRGIAAEAATALVAWLDAQGVHTVAAHIHPEHHASAAVAAAAGLCPTDARHDGELRWQRTR